MTRDRYLQHGWKDVRLGLLTAIFFLLPFTAPAQQGTTGELTGVVTAGSAPLPGVTVTITSPSLQGSQSTLTGDNGGYHFALLPPGDYMAVFELAGMDRSVQRVRISLARTTRANVELNVATMSESISVAADTADNTQVATSYRGDLVEELPSGRTLRDITLLSTSANANATSNRLMLAGAPFWSSTFLVDGAVVNDNLGGQPHDLFVEDAIEETVILSGAIPPEYGRFTGGVVSVRTRSGGNTLRGSLRTSLSNPSWTAQSPWGEGKSADDISDIHEATLGGFLVRDRLWFFTAGRLSDQTKQQTTLRTNVPYAAATSEVRWEAKLTGQLTPSQNAVVSYLDYLLEETNVVGTPGGVLDLGALIPARSNPATFLTAGYTLLLPSSTFAEAQYSRKTYALQRSGGIDRDRVLGTVIGGLGAGNINAPASCGVCGDDQRDNNSFLIKGTHYRQTRNGTHTLVGGIESFQEERVFNITRSASSYFIASSRFQFFGRNVYPIFDSSTVISRAEVQKPSSGTDFETHSVFFNDRWEIGPRFGLSLGARYDRNDARDADGNLISDDDAISPRLGAFYDLGGSGAHRLSIGYGRYVSKLPETSYVTGAAQQAGNALFSGWRYDGPAINPLGLKEGDLLSTREALAQLFAWFDLVGGTTNRDLLVTRTIPGLSTVIPRSLRSPTVDEVTAGYAVRLGTSGQVRADLIARDFGGFYAVRLDTTTGQQRDSEGRINDVNWVVNDDAETSRTYRALHLQGTWQGAALRLGGGYTLARLRGNEDGEGGITFQEPANNRPLGLFYPELLGYAQRRPVGYLTADQRHRARVWVSYDIPFLRNALNVSLLQSYDSGRAYSAAGLIDASGVVTPYAGSPDTSAYALTQLARTGYPYYFSERGAFRTEDVYSTDIALNLQLSLRRARAFVQLDLFNALNNGSVIAPSTEVQTLVRTGRNSGLIAFNPFTTTPVEGVHYRLPIDFGKATGPSSYQPPRSYGFSLGLKF